MQCIELFALDSGNLAILALLELSAAFDSIDHDTSLKRLHADVICRTWRNRHQLVHLLFIRPNNVYDQSGPAQLR